MRTGMAVLVRGKIVKGVMAMTGRTFLLQFITFSATLILTILLSPAVFGVFFIVSAVISFLTYFSDIGLAAALIQKKDEPERLELVSVFTLQQAIVLVLILLALIMEPKISLFYRLSPDGVFLLKALLLSFFLSSLKTIPSILLERRLDFSRLVIPQILENLIFYLTAVILAYRNFGITSFAWAAIFRGFAGLIGIYWISPWLPGIAFSYASIKSLITFGIPFQANSLLALVKDDLLTLYLGKVLPFSHIGYLGWAKKWAETPLRLIMDSVIRVTFPAFSRIQNDKQLLKKALEKAVLFLALFIFPASIFLAIYIKPLTELVPRYAKWQEALTAFYFFTASSILAAFSSPIVNALNALGKIKKTLGLMVVWTVLTWLLVPVLTYFFGFNGWAYASVAISSTLFLPLGMLKKEVNFNFGKNLAKPFLMILISGSLALITLPCVNNFASLGFFMLVSGLIYAVLAWKFLKNEIMPYLPKFLVKA